MEQFPVVHDGVTYPCRRDFFRSQGIWGHGAERGSVLLATGATPEEALEAARASRPFIGSVTGLSLAGQMAAEIDRIRAERANDHQG